MTRFKQYSDLIGYFLGAVGFSAIDIIVLYVAITSGLDSFANLGTSIISLFIVLLFLAPLFWWIAISELRTLKEDLEFDKIYKQIKASKNSKN